MTGDELREHLGHTVICTSAACSRHARPTILGRIEHRSHRKDCEFWLILRDGGYRKEGNVYHLTRSRKHTSKPQMRPFAWISPKLLDLDPRFAQLQGGAHLSVARGIPFTASIRCWACGNAIDLSRLRRHEVQ